MRRIPLGNLLGTAAKNKLQNIATSLTEIRDG